jgi:hypothetical protein
LKEKVAASGLKIEINTVWERYADHGTPLYSQELALNSPTSGGRLVDVVRLQTKSHGVFFCVTETE